MDETQPVANGSAVPEVDAVQPLRFTGKGREYFRIWIVNLALTVVTLGIFSAWAKVRRTQYFYRNTRLAASCFDYHGKPIAILKGRVVAVALLAIYFVADQLSPLYGLAAFAVLALVLPWLLARSFRFRLHNTSYRGIRFRFRGGTGSAYWVFLGMPILALLSFFTLVPLAHHRIKRYQIANSSFGNQSLTFHAEPWEFYRTYIIAGLVGGFLFGAAVVVLFVVTAVTRQGGTDASAAAGSTVALLLFLVLYASGIVGSQAIVTSWIQNESWGRARLGPHRIFCTIEPLKLFWILLTNLALTLITLGLFRPFAQVRLARYLLSEVALVLGGSLDEIEAAEGDEVSAFGEEAASMFDFDIAF
jgi:uncharacterized membrane protein YjgN (DUF898 family)